MAVVVIGDVVASREHPDQAALLRRMADAARAMPGARSAGPTTGDEFQGRFDDLPSAIIGCAQLRLELADTAPDGTPGPIDVRLGLGIGEVVASEGEAADAPGQSGGAWWSAREALEHVAARRRGWPAQRWWVAGAPGLAATQASLLALDVLWARFDALDVALARGVMAGESGTDLGRRHGLTRQSVSSRLHDHGVWGWVRTLQVLTQSPGEGPS